MAVEIRRLGADDVSLMQAMLKMFGDAFEDPEAYDEARPSEAYLGALLARGSFIALAAREDAAVVGGIAAYVLDKFEQERSEIYIYDLAVAASHRRQGIATALIAEMQTIAGTVGAHTIFVQADRDDEPAIALYSRLGRREDVHHFDIPPDPPD